MDFSLSKCVFNFFTSTANDSRQKKSEKNLATTRLVIIWRANVPLIYSEVIKRGSSFKTTKSVFEIKY